MFKKLLFFIIIIILLVTVYSYRVSLKYLWLDLTKEKLPQPIEFHLPENEIKETTSTKIQVNPPPNQLTPTTTPKKENQEPSVYNLKVPFSTQAPYANWNTTFKEACEEAAVLMVDFFYKHKTFTPQVSQAEILKMIDWQLKNFGEHTDLNASQTVKMIKDYLGYKKVEIIKDPTIEEIMKQIQQQRPVIMPAAGRLLANPYFRTPGPIYHMLVIKGYTKDKFITNDPGTNTKGEDFLYKFNNLMTAMHEWNEQDILQGEKKIIVIYPDN